jgi:class 3 adenylate cyclase
MPMYMDIHEVPGATPEAVARAHEADLAHQGEHGVEYLKYWVNENTGTVFCLCKAPSSEAATAVHRESHGLVASKIIEVVPEVAENFLGASAVDSAGAAIVPGSGEHDTAFRTILFTDIVESTSMAQRIGDDAAVALLNVHDAIVREALANFTGREVKHTGDGIMASFISAASAVRCATQIHSALDAYARENQEAGLRVRIGAAAGEPVESHNDLFGTTVQLASRICSHAEPDQILVSNVIAELCIGKVLQFQDLGEVAFKGFEYPVRVHAVVRPRRADVAPRDS